MLVESFLNVKRSLGSEAGFSTQRLCDVAGAGMAENVKKNRIAMKCRSDFGAVILVDWTEAARRSKTRPRIQTRFVLVCTHCFVKSLRSGFAGTFRVEERALAAGVSESSR